MSGPGSTVASGRGSITIRQVPGGRGLAPAATGRSLSAVTFLVLEAPRLTASGFGGWDVVARKGARSAVEWNGVDPRRLTFTGLLDGWRDGRSVETEIGRIENMASPMVGGYAPPLVTVSGSVPPGLPSAWVIEALEPQDGALWDPSSTYRLRQAYAITLLEHVDETLMDTRDAVRLKIPRQQIRAERYVTKKGDSLGRIASRQLGKHALWRRILELNPSVQRDAGSTRVNDPRTKLKHGQHLKMPLSWDPPAAKPKGGRS